MRDPRDEGRKVELTEEELRARTERERTGEVEIRKEGVTEAKTLDVPVTREEVVVERRPVERRPASGTVGAGETIEVPVHEERVEVEKQPVVYEEIDVGKRQVQDTERVSGTVRREEARVDTEGDVEVAPWDQARNRYRQDWETRREPSGGRWEDAEPGYRYGHEMRNDPRYKGRDWNEVESDLRSDYGGWSRRHGYGREQEDDDSAWERLKRNVREAWGGGRR